MNQSIQSALLGLATGDALGVPVEFLSRGYLKENPVTDMMGFGTHSQPAGTFSDDASLALCLADALTEEYSIYTIAQNFRQWYHEGFWSAGGEVIDIGIATLEAIGRLDEGMEPTLAGGFDEYSNGNGSLMRILPLLFYIKDKPIEERYSITKEVSSITHMHVRSVISCFYYLEFARHLLRGDDVKYIYSLLQIELTEFLKSLNINPDEIKHFDRLLKGNIYELSEDEIQSSGYVIHTLEASIWCLITTNNYKDALLKAVNLGSDTDTTAAVTGGIAGLLYGWQGIPESWLNVLAKKDAIAALCSKLAAALPENAYDFIAKLTYVAEGGRSTPAKSGYRPAVKFPFDEMYTSGMQYFLDREWVYPGETVMTGMNILAVPYFMGRLSVGDSFGFYEGSKLIGTGIITSILNNSLVKQ